MDRLARAMFDLFATFQRQWCIAVRFGPPHAPVNLALGISRRPRRLRLDWAKMSGATDVRPSNSTRLVKAFDNSSREKQVKNVLQPSITSDIVSSDQMMSAATDRLSFLGARDAHFRVHGKAKVPVTMFSQSNLVSDDEQGHLNANIQDANLINPWGVAFSQTGAVWINNNGTGTATVYQLNSSTNAISVAQSPAPGTGPFVVTVAPPAGTNITSSPTGMVSNPFAESDPTGFLVNGEPAAFIMDTEDGTISAWNTSLVTATSDETMLKVDNSKNAAAGDGALPQQDQGEGIGAVYKGLAIGTIPANGSAPAQNVLYAANFRHGTVDVFNDQWQQINSITDGDLPKGYAPFNVQAINGNLFVTFAKQDASQHDPVAGAGNGFVDEFSMSGQFEARVASHGPLNAPWGLAIAPADFGKFAGDLLVGNFGDGTISAFNLSNNQFEGKLQGANGQAIKIGDLWTLTPGNGTPTNPTANGSAADIYFTAGVKNESQGLFGAIAPIAGTSHFMVS
jgi:uncharacterized protein (TIGR03118 family)